MNLAIESLRSASTTIRSAAVNPLSSTENERCQQVAGRLHAVLRTLVGQLPAHSQGASGMARHLDVVRNTCQRVVSALDEPPSSTAVLVKLPGIRGLELLIEGFRQKGADDADIAAAASAIEQFDRLITEVAGSQLKLADRINSGGAVKPEPSAAASPAKAAETSRRNLYLAAADVMGRRCDTNISLYLFRLHPDDPSRLERVLATALLGQVARPDAMPVAFSAGDTHHEEAVTPEERPFATLDRTPAHGKTPTALLEPFCTDPLPLVTSRGSRGRLLQIVDFKAMPTDRPIDLVLANRSVHSFLIPETQQPTLDAVWSLINYPCQHLIFDVYLHVDLERRLRPSIDQQLWNPGLESHPADSWLTRFPHGPRLQLLGADARDAHTDAYSRQSELTRHLFDRVAWSASEFVGFRCEVRYPIWRSGYCMAFEYLDPKSD